MKEAGVVVVTQRYHLQLLLRNNGFDTAAEAASVASSKC